MTTVTTTIELRTAVVHDAAAPGSYCVPGPVQRTEARRLPPRLPRPVRMVPPTGRPVLEAARADLEMYGASMEERGLAASTIDRRLSTACGFYRFAHVEGRFPAQYARRPKVNPCERRGLHHGELGWFLFTAECFDRPCSSAGAVGVERPRASEACESNIEEMAIERGHRVLRVVGKGNQPALIPLVPRTVRTIDLAVGERTQGPVLVRHNGQRLDRCTAVRWANQPSGGAGWSQAGRGVASIVAAN